MVIWMIYAAAVGGLFAGGALALDSLCERTARPRRFAWLAGLTLAMVVPLTATPPDPQPNAASPDPAVAAASAPASIPASTPDPLHSPSRQPGTDSRPPGADSRPPGADSQLPGTDSRHPGADSRLPAADSRHPDLDPHPAARATLAAWALASLALATLVGTVLVGAAIARRRWERRRVAGEDVYVSRRFGPALVGVARPAIVLPRWVLKLGAAARATVVGHEREHARAGDHLVLLYGALLVAAMPWNPAVWWMFLRLRAAVEIDCDRRVLASGVHFGDYGDLLLAVGARRSGRPFYALTMAGSRSMLERRLKAMNTNQATRNVRKSTLALLGCAALAATVAACGVKAPTGIAPAIDEALAAPQATEEAAARKAEEEAAARRAVEEAAARRAEEAAAARRAARQDRLRALPTDTDGRLHVRGIHGSPSLVLNAESVALDPVVIVDGVVLDGGLAALLAGDPLDIRMIGYTREPNVFPAPAGQASRGVVYLRTVANPRELVIEGRRPDLEALVRQLRETQERAAAQRSEQVEAIQRQLEAQRPDLEALVRQLRETQERAAAQRSERVEAIQRLLEAQRPDLDALVRQLRETQERAAAQRSKQVEAIQRLLEEQRPDLESLVRQLRETQERVAAQRSEQVEAIQRLLEEQRPDLESLVRQLRETQQKAAVRRGREIRRGGSLP